MLRRDLHMGMSWRAAITGGASALAAGALWLFALAGPAAAEAVDDTYTCVFRGSTKGLDDPPSLPSLGGHGGYDSESLSAGNPPGVRCLHIDADHDGDDDTGIWDGVLESTGSYQMTVCATGHFHGHDWLDPGNQDHPPGPGPAHDPRNYPSVTSLRLNREVAAPGDTNDRNEDSPLTDITYDISFLAGLGAMQITAAADGDGDTLTANGAGTLNIQPKDYEHPNQPHRIPCVTAATNDFDFTGSFTLVTGSEPQQL